MACRTYLQREAPVLKEVLAARGQQRGAHPGQPPDRDGHVLVLFTHTRIEAHMTELARSGASVGSDGVGVAWPSLTSAWLMLSSLSTGSSLAMTAPRYGDITLHTATNNTRAATSMQGQESADPRKAWGRGPGGGGADGWSVLVGW